MTPANQLTVVRMIASPLFILLVVYQQLGGAVLVFLLAGITDLLDGLIARRFGHRTPLGTFLDPAADKLLLVSSFLILSLDNLGLTVTMPLWLTITVLGRDVLLVLSVLIINLTLGRHLFRPSLWGKATTSAQLLTVMITLVDNYLGWEAGPLWTLSVYLTLTLTVISGIHYASRGRQFLGSDRESA